VEGRVYKLIAITTAVVVVSLWAIACGGESGSTTQDKAGVGDRLNIAGNDARLEVTLEGTKRLPAAKADGVEVHPALFGTQLTIKNVGDRFYDDAVSLCAVLADARGQSHNAEFATSDESSSMPDDTLEAVRIAPGDERSGWVYFALGPEQEPRSLRFTAESGFGPDVGEWSLK
jgi:hypothetical protein